MSSIQPTGIDRSGLKNTIFQSYTHLRVGMGVLAFAFPLILWCGGRYIAHLELQGSMSAYYHTEMRNAFVGILFALGTFLYLYKGFSRVENYVLNCAGVCALGVAIFPMEVPPGIEECPTYTAGHLHSASAILFFVCIAYVCIFRAKDTLYLVDGSRRKFFGFMYKFLGISMVVAALTSAALYYFRGEMKPEMQAKTERNSILFVAELSAIWIFSGYWLLKSYEVSVTRADLVVAQSD